MTHVCVRDYILNLSITVLCGSFGSSVCAAPKPLVHEGIIPASRAEVWKAFTTKEGIESWMVAKGDIDLRVGGKMRTTYDPQATLGDENTIVNTILSLEPERMLSLKATKAPASFPFKEALKSTWSVIYFDDINRNETRLRIVGLGYGEDEESQRMREFFRAGNAWTINKLRAKFGGGPPGKSSETTQTPDSSNAASDHDGDTWTLVRRLTGGEWIHESTGEDGAVFRARNILKHGPGKSSIIGRSWLGSVEGMYEHGNSLIWLEPGTGQVRFQNINEAGSVATGRIVLQDRNTLIWDWQVHTQSDKHVQFQVNTTFNGNDAYRMQLYRMDDEGKFQKLTNIDFHRVKNAPAEYKKLRADKSHEPGNG